MIGTGKVWWMLGALLVIFTALAGPVRADAVKYKKALVIYGEGARSGEVHAARELARDLERVCGVGARVAAADGPEAAAGPDSGLGRDEAVFYVGTRDTHSGVRRLAEAGVVKVAADDPGPEAFVLRGLPDQGAVVIAGCDERGTLYGVYEYSERFLGIDPMEYWTGRTPEQRAGLTIADFTVREDPPAFPLRGYFDNDSDMLANFSGQKLVIEFEVWKQMIDSLARLRYNYIDPFDTMGRSEFWVWPYYREMAPDYHTDLDLVRRVMAYAHEKGMMVQVSTYLGWEFYHLPREQKCLSQHHDDWMNAYRYLLENTPVGDADLFLHSPRDPWWDWPYRCGPEMALGIRPEPLHTRVINELLVMVHEHNPEAKLFCNLWSDGKKGWSAGRFAPDRSIDAVWSDDGYARYPDWPDDLQGHRFGIYIHAGFWKNHVIQDPYPERIRESTREAYRRGLTADYFVNGQDFKHFILNLEACARAAWDPEGFDPDEYYREWTVRYFGEAAAPGAVESFQSLHRAHELAGGFVQITQLTKIYLELVKFKVPYCRDYSYLKPARAEAEKAVESARRARDLVPAAARLVFDDQVLFPAEIYLANLKLHQAVAGMIAARCDLLNPMVLPGRKREAAAELREYRTQAPERLQALRDLLEAGSGWNKWDGWTRPENFRKQEPPLRMEQLKTALRLR